VQAMPDANRRYISSVLKWNVWTVEVRIVVPELVMLNMQITVPMDKDITYAIIKIDEKLTYK